MWQIQRMPCCLKRKNMRNLLDSKQCKNNNYLVFLLFSLSVGVFPFRAYNCSRFPVVTGVRMQTVSRKTGKCQSETPLFRRPWARVTASCIFYVTRNFSRGKKFNWSKQSCRRAGQLWRPWAGSKPKTEATPLPALAPSEINCGRKSRVVAPDCP